MIAQLPRKSKKKKQLFPNKTGLKRKTQKQNTIKNTGGTSLIVQWLRLCSQGRGQGFNPWSGNQSPHTAPEDPAIKTEDPVCHN